MSSTLPQLCIDGRWIACQDADGFGALGIRYLCELGSSPGQPTKKLLVRQQVWPQTGGTSGETFAKLTTGTVPSAESLGLRAVMVNKYQQTVTQADGTPRVNVCPVLQQDVTGLISLKQAILRAIKGNQPQQIWQLFYYACKALDNFGVAIGAGRPVPLQCPESLAVDANNRVVPLDAAMLVAGSVPADSEANRMYRSWFGEEGSKGFASRDNASVMHAKALVLYFHRLLGAWQQKTAGTNRQLPAKVVAPLERMPAGASLNDFEHWIQESAEDWNITIEDEEDSPRKSPARATSGTLEPMPLPLPPSNKGSGLLLGSLCLNLLLIVAVVLLLLFGRTGTSAVVPPKDDVASLNNSTLFFSSYCVVFPTQGTISEKVGSALQDLFPDKFEEIKRHAPDHDKLLRLKLAEAIRSIASTDKLKQLLIKLAADHSIRFKGFVAGEPEEGLISVIERGGIFSIANASREEYGSLLQINGLDKILERAGLRDQNEVHDLLASLKNAIAEYASLKDALSIIGDRTAYLLHVEPTATAHEQARRRLLSRLDKPVFISRPIPEFFDAVDPTADTGGGVASYSLRLDRKCFWRLASRDDRQDVDYQNNSSNDRMKWQTFDAGQQISWRPITLTKKNGKIAPVASFDIGVLLDNKVVVFRNQSLLVGDSRNQVFTQGRNYVEKTLRLQNSTIEDAISVRQQEGQFTGTLIYSYLAEKVTVENSTGDLELLDLDMFEQQKSQEDNP